MAVTVLAHMAELGKVLLREHLEKQTENCFRVAAQLRGTMLQSLKTEFQTRVMVVTVTGQQA